MKIPGKIPSALGLRKAALTACAAVLAIWAAATPASAEKIIRQYLADGFDFPVGKPDSYGYYKARGFWPNGHMGEDWNGRGGGNSDLGDPVYSIGRGVVVFSDDYRRGWGNVVIIRHAYRDESGRVFMVDSQYGHLDRRLVKKYQLVKRGQQIGTIGTARGIYLAHLHLEVHKNLNIGLFRSSFSRGYENYFDPTDFIRKRRKLRTGFRMHPIPVDTFGKGKANPTRLTQATIPAEKPPVAPENPAANRNPAVPGAPTKPPVPKEVDEALKEHSKGFRDNLRSFWTKIRRRLDAQDDSS